MPRMGRPGRGLALALWCHYAAEAQSPTQAPTFTTWRPTVAGASSPATTPAPSLRPTPAPTTPRPTSTSAPTCVAESSTAAAAEIDCLLQACRDCLGPSTADGGVAGARCTNLAEPSCKKACVWAIKEDLGNWDSFGVRDGADQTQLDGFLASDCEYVDEGTEMTASNWFRGTNALNGEPFGRLGLQMGAPSPRPTMASDFLDAAQCLCCYDAALDTGCFGQSSCACCCGSANELEPETSWPGDKDKPEFYVDGGYPAEDCKKDCEKEFPGWTCVYAKEGKTDIQKPKKDKYIDDDTKTKIEKDSTATNKWLCDVNGAAAARPWWLLLAALVIILR